MNEIRLILQFPPSILIKGVSALIFNHSCLLDFTQTISLRISSEAATAKRATAIFMPFRIDGLNTGNDDGLDLPGMAGLKPPIFRLHGKSSTSLFLEKKLFLFNKHLTSNVVKIFSHQILHFLQHYCYYY